MSLQKDIQGHWVRNWIKSHDFEDHKTRVHWAQVGLDYADVRIPLERPDLSKATALASLSAPELAVLAQAEGFAGHVTLDGSCCTWHREINFHGKPEIADIGAISFDADGRMIEAGVLAEYTELWERFTFADAKVIRFSGAGYVGHLIGFGKTCVVGIGKRNKPTTKTLIETLHAGHVPINIEELFDGIYAIGHWSEEMLIADLATQPFADGLPVLTLKANTILWHRIGFDGICSDVVFEMDTVGA